MAKEKFETQMKRLEEIVALLEAETVDLDTSIKLYEEGLKLNKKLQMQLSAFEKKIEDINMSGENDE